MYDHKTTREQIISRIKKMRENTVENGCTPGEAAKFAAKVAELVEQYQIDEAQLRRETASVGAIPEEMEVYQNYLRTGKRVHNPGTTAVVAGLARGMSCEVVLLPAGWEGRDDASYGVIGDQLDADYVCQIATCVVPALRMMATLEGREHGHEGGDLVKWMNQYLCGAGAEIQRRLEKDRKDRSDVAEQKRVAGACTALAVITGETLAVAKREASAEGLKRLYPATRNVKSRTEYDHTARERGAAAGRAVGLNIQVEG